MGVKGPSAAAMRSGLCRIADALAHLDDLSTEHAPAPRPGAVAADLAQHLGDPAAMDKALRALPRELAAADAAAKVPASWPSACGARVRAMMRTEGEQIAASFGGLWPTTSPPSRARPDCSPNGSPPSAAANLDPATFEAGPRHATPMPTSSPSRPPSRPCTPAPSARRSGRTSRSPPPPGSGSPSRRSSPPRATPTPSATRSRAAPTGLTCSLTVRRSSTACSSRPRSHTSDQRSSGRRRPR